MQNQQALTTSSELGKLIFEEARQLAISNLNYRISGNRLDLSKMAQHQQRLDDLCKQAAEHLTSN